jgi:hypothetical protein
LPVPTAKLSVVRHAAQLLLSGDDRDRFWNIYLDWISELEFESEVAEALAIPILAKTSDTVDITRLRQAIPKHSVLSDLLLSELSGSTGLINIWIKAHSEEAPPFFLGRELITELNDGRIVPRILCTRMKRLEAASGKPFEKQWAFEYYRLCELFGKQWDGSWQYFGEHGNDQSGQFITRRGHVARSAYIRTLAFAVDLWNLPESIAFNESMYASPLDLCFIRMPPGEIPAWAIEFHGNTPTTEEEWKDLVLKIDNQLTHETFSCLAYLSAPLTLNKRYQADLEIITFLHDEGDMPKPEEAWEIHDWLPGRIELERTTDSAIRIVHQGELLFPTESGGNLAPALLPAVVRHVGYMHADVLGRMPYVPANYPGDYPVIAVPRNGGMDFMSNETCIGVMEHWNYRWSPTHHKSLAPHCGITVRISPAENLRLLAVPGMTISRAWRAKIVSRDEDYGEMKEMVFSGLVPRSS